MSKNYRSWLVLIAIYGVFFLWYTDLGGKLNSDEIETYLVKLQENSKAKGISSPELDKIYDLAKKNGAIGGKISGAGGGGFYTFYCEDKQAQLRKAMAESGLRELNYNFDFEGTKVLANFMNYSPETINDE